MEIIKSIFGGSIIRKRVMASVNARISKAEKELQDGVKDLEKKFEADKRELEDKIVTDLTAFIK